MATKIVDRGWKRIKQELKRFQSTTLLVGTFGGVEYAGYVEFGTYKMSARPYIRSTFESKGAAMASAIEVSFSNVLGGGSALGEAKKLGVQYEGFIKRQFRTFGKPPIDTGRLINSITYEIA